MKYNKVILALAILLSVLAVTASYSNAASAWYTCKVTMAGPGGTGTYIRLSHDSTTPSFTSKWFVPNTGREKEMLALAMAAISNGQRVYVYTDIAKSGYPVIFSLYLMR